MGVGMGVVTDGTLSWTGRVGMGVTDGNGHG